MTIAAFDARVCMCDGNVIDGRLADLVTVTDGKLRIRRQVLSVLARLRSTVRDRTKRGDGERTGLP